MKDKASKAKKDLMLYLAADRTIFDAINNPNIPFVNYDDLIGENIFPYLKIDYTVQQAGTFIGVKIDYPSVNMNEIYKNVLITFLVVSSNGQLRTPQGDCRTDLIAERICELLDWSTAMGFRIELVSDKEDPLNGEFYYREIIFRSVSTNGIENGVKINS